MFWQLFIQSVTLFTCNYYLGIIPFNLIETHCPKSAWTLLYYSEDNIKKVLQNPFFTVHPTLLQGRHLPPTSSIHLPILPQATSNPLQSLPSVPGWWRGLQSSLTATTFLLLARADTSSQLLPILLQNPAFQQHSNRKRKENLPAMLSSMCKQEEDFTLTLTRGWRGWQDNKL